MFVRSNRALTALEVESEEKAVNGMNSAIESLPARTGVEPASLVCDERVYRRNRALTASKNRIWEKQQAKCAVARATAWFR
jgi:hypothetical protein